MLKVVKLQVISSCSEQNIFILVDKMFRYISIGLSRLIDRFFTNLLNIKIIIIIIYGICNAPLPKDTKRRQQYNKNKQNRLRIKVSFKMRLEYGNRRSTADVNGDGVPFQGSSH